MPVTAENTLVTRTYTYKVAGGCQIKADVHMQSGGRIPSPAVVFLHGGGLIMGNRKGSPLLIELLARAGYVVVSIDYRLAPETKLPHLIEDLQDAFAWARDKGTDLGIDPDRIAVAGNSAGGYLTLMAGLTVDPPPKALVSFYGYGDIDGPWISRPDPFYCKRPPIDESAARASIRTQAISETSGPEGRDLLYVYCRQRGILPKEVMGHDPASEPRELFDPFCPVRNITQRYPPAMMLHGDQDTDVPYDQSVLMARRLSEVDVEHEIITMSGMGHDFEQAGYAEPMVADALSRVRVFLARHV